jgi:hypothetical protein
MFCPVHVGIANFPAANHDAAAAALTISMIFQPLAA